MFIDKIEINMCKPPVSSPDEDEAKDPTADDRD